MWHVVSPQAPLTASERPGRLCYLVPSAGQPDAETFWASTGLLAEFHDRLWNRTGIAPGRTVLGGFSMGAAMSYALSLGARRPPPAGIMALSGCMPRVPDWSPCYATVGGLRAFIAHGRRDTTIDAQFAQQARSELEAHGVTVDYHKTGAGHRIDAAYLPAASDWLAQMVAPVTSLL